MLNRVGMVTVGKVVEVTVWCVDRVVDVTMCCVDRVGVVIV